MLLFNKLVLVIILFKNNFIILNIKKLLLPIIFVGFTLALIIFSKENLNAAKTRTCTVGRLSFTSPSPFLHRN